MAALAGGTQFGAGAPVRLDCPPIQLAATSRCSPRSGDPYKDPPQTVLRAKRHPRRAGNHLILLCLGDHATMLEHFLTTTTRCGLTPRAGPYRLSRPRHDRVGRSRFVVVIRAASRRLVAEAASPARQSGGRTASFAAGSRSRKFVHTPTLSSFLSPSTRRGAETTIVLGDTAQPGVPRHDLVPRCRGSGPRLWTARSCLQLYGPPALAQVRRDQSGPRESAPDPSEPVGRPCDRSPRRYLAGRRWVSSISQ